MFTRAETHVAGIESPVWPATKRNLLAYCRTARRNLRECSTKHSFDIGFYRNRARKCLVAMRFGGAA